AHGRDRGRYRLRAGGRRRRRRFHARKGVRRDAREGGRDVQGHRDGGGDVNGLAPKLAVVDNYDSFTYNLVQYLAELGAEPAVFRNDAVTVDELGAFEGVVISPGPGTPEEAGISTEAIRELTGRVAILGVCLGNQCLGEAFGGRVVRNAPSHGKTS